MNKMKFAAVLMSIVVSACSSSEPPKIGPRAGVTYSFGASAREGDFKGEAAVNLSSMFDTNTSDYDSQEACEKAVNDELKNISAEQFQLALYDRVQNKAYNKAENISEACANSFQATLTSYTAACEFNGYDSYTGVLRYTYSWNCTDAAGAPSANTSPNSDSDNGENY